MAIYKKKNNKKYLYYNFLLQIILVFQNWPNCPIKGFVLAVLANRKVAYNKCGPFLQRPPVKLNQTNMGQPTLLPN